MSIMIKELEMAEFVYYIMKNIQMKHTEETTPNVWIEII